MNSYLNLFSDGGQYTIINLEYVFTTGLSGESQPHRPYVETPVRTTQRPVVQTRPPTQQFTRPPAQQFTQPPQATQNFKVDDNVECGISAGAPFATGLVLGGQSSNRGQFPWYLNCDILKEYSTQLHFSFKVGCIFL